MKQQQLPSAGRTTSAPGETLREGHHPQSKAPLPPGSASLPSLVSPPTAAAPATFGGMWQSLIAPIKKFWEVPTIHVSTYYGTANQLGRPGPVLAVVVERAAVLRSRAKQRLKRQQQHQKLLAAASAASSLSSLASLPIGATTTNNNNGQPTPANATGPPPIAASTSTPVVGAQRGTRRGPEPSSSPAPPGASGTSPPPEDGGTSVDIEGVLLVTPRSIERYQLNGVPIKRAALPDTITAFNAAKVAGVGRVFICGTQNGRLHVLKTNLLDAMLVFDTGSLSAKAVTAMRRRVSSPILPQQRPTQSGRSELSFASDEGQQRSFSVFADPPRLLAEAVLMAATAAGVEAPPLEGPPEDVDAVFRRLGTVTGDGITPALLEGRAEELLYRQARREPPPSIEEPIVQEALERLASTTSPGPIPLPPPIGAAPSAVLGSLLQEATRARTEICSIATSCSFSNFCEIILAGTVRGEIFGWQVPSGRLTFAFDYPVVTDASATTDSQFVAAMETITIRDTTQYLWAGYGTGYLAIYNLTLGQREHLLEVPGQRPVVAIEVATQLAVVLVLAGNAVLTVWSCNNADAPKLLTSFNTSQLTNGIPLSCFKAVEPIRRTGYMAMSSILFLGCVDGSLFVHKLSWSGGEQHTTGQTIIPQNYIARLRTLSGATGFVDDITVAPSHVVDTATLQPSTLECRLLKSFDREVEPKCPVSALWVDPAVDTVFVGDASGVVATLLPIRYLLNDVNSNGSSGSSPLLTSQQRRAQARLTSIEYRCPPEQPKTTTTTDASP